MPISESELEMWKERLLSLKDVIARVHSQLAGPQELQATLSRISTEFEEDIEAFQNQAGFIFKPKVETENYTERNVELIGHWHSTARAPSLASMCAYTMSYLKLDLSDTFMNAVLAGAVLGEYENDNAFHNNLHFKKVLLQTLRMIAAHNDIYAGTPQILDSRSIVLLLIAACIHDLGHDGKGNTIKGVQIAGRLEEQSHNIAAPYLEAAGLSDSSFLEDLKIMILATDAAPMGEPSSPANQAKAAYRYHFKGGQSKTYALNLDPQLSRLQEDKTLALLSLILHEADIATSAGLDYRVTKVETMSLMKEIGKDEAYPEQVLDFLNHICQRAFLTDAGQRLYAANMARIYALVEQDVKAGNLPFESFDPSDLRFPASDDGLHPKTIN